MKKRFTYEYDYTTEGIFKSFTGKSSLTPRELQKLFDSLIAKEYTINTKKQFKPGVSK